MRTYVAVTGTRHAVADGEKTTLCGVLRGYGYMADEGVTVTCRRCIRAEDKGRTESAGTTARRRLAAALAEPTPGIRP